MTDVTKDNIEPKSNTENEISYLVVDKTYLPFFEFNSWENLFFYFHFPEMIVLIQKIGSYTIAPPPPGSKGWGLGQS